MLLFERTATIAVAEFTKLFVEGDKKRAVSVDFKCCAYSTAKLSIARNTGSNGEHLNLTLKAVREDDGDVDPGQCACLCHEVPTPPVSQSRQMFRPAPIKGRARVVIPSSVTYTDFEGGTAAYESNSEVYGEDEDEDISPPEVVPCNFCDKVFMSKDTLLKHQSKHHKQESTENSQAQPEKKSEKKPVIVQNPDGTSVITVPPNFWKDDNSKENDQSDDDTIVDAKDEADGSDKSDIEEGTNGHHDADNEEDVINSLHDVMNDFIGDSNDSEEIEADENDPEVDSVKEELENDDESSVDGNLTTRSLPQERKRARKEKDITYQPSKKRVKATESPPTDVRLRKSNRRKVFSGVIEIDSDNSETEYVEREISKRQSSGDKNVKRKSKSISGPVTKTEMVLSFKGKIDKNIQTVATYQMNTNANKAGKVLTCSGNFEEGKLDLVTRQALARLHALARSKYTQTGKRKKGKVLYPSAELPSIESDEPPIYDCTFHKYCIANKTTFSSKEELTKHIVTGFKNTPNMASEYRAPTGYQKKFNQKKGKSKPAESKSMANEDSNSIESSDSTDDKFYTKEQLSKKIVSNFMLSRASTKSMVKTEYDCPVCTSQFSTPQSLYAHMQNDHSQSMVSNNAGRQNRKKKQTIQKPARLPSVAAEPSQDKVLLSTKELTEVVYPCPVCKAIFYHDFELEGHIKTEHKPDDESDMEDEDYGVAEDYNNPVTKMMKAVGDTSEDDKAGPSAPQVQQAGMTRCPICPSNLAVFGNVNDLQVHLSETHGVRAKVVNLADKKGAENSMSKYGGHYECPVCALLFSTSADMYSHLNTSHMKQVRKNWKAPPKQQKGEKVAQDAYSTDTDDSYQCTKCDKVFNSKSDMMIHAEFKH